MDIRLENKTALVCGSSQGIGKAIAIQFAEMGANLILVARNENALQKVISELPTNNKQKHNYIKTDFSQYEKAIKTINNFLNKFDLNSVDILVNNSGGPAYGQILEDTPEKFIDAFNQHLILSHTLVQALINPMKEKKWGRILNVISISTKQPIENLGVSNTVRGAMASWSKTLSRELAPYGITVNNLLPGYTATTRLEILLKNNADQSGKSIDEISSQIISSIPTRRFGKPEEVAYLAGFLASDYASYITGVSVPVDGGFLRSL
ncbi:MAG: SDR family oxidoreductase [Bacteroidota bacterium]